MNARRLISQVASTAGVNAWLAGLGLYTTPIVLKGLGNEPYGIFALVSLVSAHLSNLELGFGQATIRYLARANGAGEQREASEILNTSFAVFMAAAFVAGLAFWLGPPFLVHRVFTIPLSLRPSALIVFHLGAWILACSFLSSLFSSAMQALGAFTWLNGSRFLFGTLASLGSVWVVRRGGGVDDIFVLQAIVATSSCLILGGLVSWERRELLLPIVSFVRLREMASFGAIVFAAGLAYQVLINGPASILAMWVPVGEMPWFSIPQAVLQKMIMMMTAASAAFFPFAAAASLEDDRTRLAEVFRSHLRLTGLVFGPMVAFLSIYSFLLLRVWLGVDFAVHATPPLRALAFATLVLALGGPPADVARGLGHPRWVLAYTVAVAIAGLAFALWWVPTAGAFGAASATAASLTIGTAPLAWVVGSRLLGLSARDLALDAAGVVVAVVSVAAVFGLCRWLIEEPVASVASCGVGGLIYLVGVDRWVLREKERSAFRHAFRAR